MDDQIYPICHDLPVESQSVAELPKLMDVNFHPIYQAYLIPISEKLIDTMDWPEGTVVKWYVEGDTLVLKKFS